MRAYIGLFCSVLAVVFCGASLAAKPIKIGLAGPFSGNAASFGEQLRQGGQLAVKHINAAGGINGRKVELVEGDDACEPKQAVTVANRLVSKDRVDAVVGHFCSSSTIPASVVYNNAGIMMITPASTNPTVTGRGFKTVFRTCGRDDQQGIIAANFIAKRLKAKRVAVIHDKDTYGQGLADATKGNLRKAGIKEVLYEGLTRGEKDFNALVTKIKKSKADTVFFGGIHSEAGLLVRQMRQQGLKAHFVTGDGIVGGEFIVAAGGKKFANGVYMTFSRDPRHQPAGKKVVAEYRKMKFEPEGYTLYSYAAIQAIAAAMRGTGKKTNGLKMSNWLKKNSVNTVLGKKSWDNKGDLTSADYVVYQWDSKGNYNELKSSEI